MGIDCYLYTEKEQKYRQYQYALCDCGELKWKDLPRSESHAYIRESYHGGPYITHDLFPECFIAIYDTLRKEIGDVYADWDIVCNAPPEVLWERFRRNQDKIKQRGDLVYRDSDYAKEQTQTVREFLEKYEKMYKEGKRPVVYISY